MSESEKARGSRGDFVGTASAGQTVKQLHQAANSHLSLKRFVRQLLSEGGDNAKVAKEWVLNKRGACNQKRSEKNISRIALEKIATKNAKRSAKSKGGGAGAKEEKAPKAPKVK
jgi:hypothetical protein